MFGFNGGLHPNAVSCALIYGNESSVFVLGCDALPSTSTQAGRLRYGHRGRLATGFSRRLRLGIDDGTHPLCQDVVDYVSVNVGQAHISGAETMRDLLVV